MSRRYWPSHHTIPLEDGAVSHPGDTYEVRWSHPRDTLATFHIEIGRWNINAYRREWLRQVSTFALPFRGVVATIDFLIGLTLEEMDSGEFADGYILLGFQENGDRIRFDPASHIYTIAATCDRRFILNLTQPDGRGHPSAGLRKWSHHAAAHREHIGDPLLVERR
jgi:hypothetical protein